jgi:hypothetical protein
VAGKRGANRIGRVCCLERNTASSRRRRGCMQPFALCLTGPFSAPGAQSRELHCPSLSFDARQVACSEVVYVNPKISYPQLHGRVGLRNRRLDFVFASIVEIAGCGGAQPCCCFWRDEVPFSSLAYNRMLYAVCCEKLTVSRSAVPPKCQRHSQSHSVKISAQICDARYCRMRCGVFGQGKRPFRFERVEPF